MAKYTADSKYLASIYPGELEVIRFSVGPEPTETRLDKNGRPVRNGFSTSYHIPPFNLARNQRPKDLPDNVKYANGAYVLEVTDGFELVEDAAQSAEVGRKIRNPK